VAKVYIYLLFFLSTSILFVNIYGLVDNPMRFRTLSNQKIILTEYPEVKYYVTHDNVSSPMACTSLCKTDEVCMTATFNVTSNVCSLSMLPSMHEADKYRLHWFETSPAVNSYAKFRYRGIQFICHIIFWYYVCPAG